MSLRPSPFCSACRKPKRNSGKFCKNCYIIRSKYSVEPKDIHELRIAQIDKCAICQTNATSSRELSIDHDHATDKIRGLLCTRCNLGLGYFYTSELLEAALRYLNQPIPNLSYIPRRPPKPQGRSNEDQEAKALNNESLVTLRAKSRYLAQLAGIEEEAAMSRLRRRVACRSVSGNSDTPEDVTR